MIFSRLFFYFLIVPFLLVGCSIATTRPVQEMNNTVAAIKAAREVQADSRAPELFRQANEWFFRAKEQYKLKNFKQAKQYAAKARRFAEEAEFEALNAGSIRTHLPPDPYAEAETKPKPPKKFKPEPKKERFYESYEEEQKFNQKIELEKASNPPSPGTTQQVIVNPSGSTSPNPSPTK